jgi:hypothetical protein
VNNFGESRLSSGEIADLTNQKYKKVFPKALSDCQETPVCI